MCRKTGKIKYCVKKPAALLILSASLMLSASVSYAGVKDSGSLAIGVQLKSVPPQPVTDLYASPASGYGVINITWSAVSCGYGLKLQDNPAYRVNISTQEPSGFLDANDWWDNADILQVIDISIAAEPGSSEEREITGLLPGTEYFIGVKAFSMGLWSTDLNVASAETYDIPDAPSGFTGLGVSTSATRWTWTDNSDNEDGFEILDGQGQVLVSSAALISGTTEYEQADLSPNTSSYFYGVRAVNEFGSSPISLADPHPAYSLSNIPAGPSVTEVFTSSVTLSWENAGNPGWTRYGLAYAEDGLFTIGHGTAAAWGDGITDTYFTVEGLDSGATYYFRIWAYNGNQVITGYSDTVSAATSLAGAPSLVSPPDASYSNDPDMLFSWSGIDIAGIEYRLEVSTEAGLTSVLESTHTSVPQANIGLPGEGVYYWRAGARAGSGVFEYSGAWSVTLDTTPPHSVEAEIGVILDTSLTAAAAAEDELSGLAAEAFKYALSSYENFSSSVSSGWSGDEYAWTDLGRGATYWIRAQARDRAGNITGWSGSVKAVTLSEKIYVNEEFTIVDEAQSSAVTVPAGAFGNTPVRGVVRELTPEETVSRALADSRLPRGAMHIAEPRNYLVVDINGDPVTDFSGVPPGGIIIRFTYPAWLTRTDELKLRIVKLNQIANEWEVMENYDLYAGENRIQAYLSSLSIYSLAVFPFNDIESVFIYPNPLKPGDPDYGEVAGGGIIIGGLPEGAGIRIFNIAGEPVGSFTHNGPGTSYQWEDASEIASGVYILVVNYDGKVKTVKFAVVK